MSEVSEKKQFNKLEKIKGHKNFYRNPISQIIYYKKKKHRFSTGVTQILKAKTIAEEKILAIETHAPLSEIKRTIYGIRNPLLKEMWEEFVEFKKPESLENTIINYYKNWNHGLEFWHEKYVLDLNDKAIIAFRDWYLQEKPTRKFHHTFYHFQSFLRFLKDRRVLKEVPNLDSLQKVIDIVERNARREKLGRVYSEYEIKSLLEACNQIEEKESTLTAMNKRKKIAANRARLGLLLGVYGGLRKGEVLSLKREHINFQKKELKVWSTKNSEWRIIPLFAEDLVSSLKLQFELTDSQWLFPMSKDKSKHISSQLFDNVWVRIKEIAGIKGRARFHDLRHTFATRLAVKDWQPLHAVTILDMSLSVYEKVYFHPSKKKIKELYLETFGKGEKEVR